MPAVGPQLPPHLAAKRKREEGGDDEGSDGGDGGQADASSPQSADSAAAKRPRVIGPALPPAADEQQHGEDKGSNNDASSNDDEDDDDSDDDFGPALPTAAETQKASLAPQLPPPTATAGQQPAAPSKRDEWMTLAPSSGDWSARIDPTKLKNRKFTTGKKAAPSASPGSGNAVWHETPEQKQARLQRELMGIKDGPATSTAPHNYQQDAEEAAATKQRMKEYNESRGPSLYQAHQQQKKGKNGNNADGGDDDDDPSARPFDRDKDIAGGLQMSAARRRELMQKASDFGSRFSSAKYL